jgi:hypothetical protein
MCTKPATQSLCAPMYVCRAVNSELVLSKVCVWRPQYCAPQSECMAPAIFNYVCLNACVRRTLNFVYVPCAHVLNSLYWVCLLQCMCAEVSIEFMRSDASVGHYTEFLCTPRNSMCLELNIMSLCAPMYMCRANYTAYVRPTVRVMSPLNNACGP